MSLKVAEWIRVSDESQASPERFGIPAQRTVNRETCKQYDLEVVKTFEVSDVSGKDIMLAPETAELINLMQSGRIQGVVAREFSRLMRPDSFSDYTLLGVFQQTRTLLYLPEGPVNMSEKTGRLMASVQAAIAGFERSTIRERLHRGNEENRKSGGRFASTLPKGVGYSKEKGWFYTDQAQRVKEAYELVLSGESLNEIGRFLGMSPVGVRYMIHNPIYKGWRIYERECAEARPSKNGRQPKYRPLKQRSPENVIRAQVIKEPLVSPEVWSRACKILDVKSESSRRDRVGGIASYNGFLFCNECGRIMTPIRGSGKGYYVCLNRYQRRNCSQGYVRIAEMEGRVDSLLSWQMTDPAFLRRLVMRWEVNSRDTKNASVIDRLQLEQKALERKRVRTIDIYADGDITKQERTERLGVIAQQLGRLEEEISRLRESAQPTESSQLVEMFKVFAGFDTRPKEDRRKLLSLYIPRIRIKDGEVVSLYRLLDNVESRYDKKCSRS
ncbi:recombinase family protein [Telmatobacter sp. DSM 110680]|uniref:Recombinase family protein n=1 Tax=Telmatobacter sp. DSM 110680 TaxID=3036704 RepID=A0AAU7DFL2_9BACT